MAEPDKKAVTMEELLVSSLAQADALAKLLIEKGIITREEFMQKIAEERATYQKLLNPIVCPGSILRELAQSYPW
jgi:predicted transcriptional regulator